MSEATRNPHQPVNTPALETLEDRLMLTTLYSGEFFIYMNSQGDAVRVSLDVGNGGSGAVVELFAHRLVDPLDDTQGEMIVHLPGIRYLAGGGIELVNWWDNQPVVEQQPQSGGGQGGGTPANTDWSWVEFAEADGQGAAEKRGANVEIFTIFVSKATPETTLTLTTLSDASIPSETDGGMDDTDWYDSASIWDSSNTPILRYGAIPSGGGDAPTVTAPADSGGVIVGSKQVQGQPGDPDADGNLTKEADEMSRYEAVRSDEPFWSPPIFPTLVSSVWPMVGSTPLSERATDINGASAPARNSYFTDELMYPGITVAPGSFQLSTSSPIGFNVHGVAADGSGVVYAVDSSAFYAAVVNDDDSGALGNDVDSLASVQNDDGSVTFYAVDNDGSGVLGDPINMTVGSDVRAIAAAGDTGTYAGALFMVNEATHHLLMWTEATGMTDIGQVTDASQISFRFDNIQSLDYNESNDLLYAIATLTNTGAVTTPDDTGPFLITINPLNGLVTQRVQLYTDAGLTTKFSGSMTALTITEGGTYYAVNGVNELVTIDPSTGVITFFGNLVDAGTGDSVSIVGLDVVGNGVDEALYGVTVDSLYRIAVDDPNKGQCTWLKNAGFGGDGMQSLAYDSSRPGSMYTLADIGGSTYKMGRIPLGATFVTSDSSGVVQAGSVLVDSAVDTIVWDNVHALEYDTVFEKIYGVATQLDLTSYGPPIADYFIIEIDPTTGVVTSGARLEFANQPTDLASIAFDSTGQAWGIEPGTRELYKFDPGNGTGTIEATLPVGTEIVGLAFVDVNGVDVLYGVTNDDIYVINTATGALYDMTGVGAANTVGSTSLGSLTEDPSDGLVLWATSDGSDGQARLTRIDLSATLVKITPADGTVERIGGLVDSAEGSFGFGEVTSIEYNTDDGSFYIVGKKLDLNPTDGTVPPAGQIIATLDVANTEATDVTGVELTEDVVSIAYDDVANVWYAATAGAFFDSLFDLNMATSALTNGGAFNSPTGAPVGVTGLDFEDGVLYLSDSGTPGLFEVDPVSALVNKIADSGFSLYSLSGDPGLDEQLWSTTTIGNQAYLIDVSANPLEAQQEIDKIFIGGTLAGRFSMVGNIEALRMGFFWGQVQIDGNCTLFATQTGGGVVPGFTDDTTIGVYSTENEVVEEDLGGNPPPPPGIPRQLNTTFTYQSLINITGVSGGIYALSADAPYALYSAIQVGSNRFAEMPSTDIIEFEDRQKGDTDDSGQDQYAYERAWMSGRPVDWVNDTPELAQFLNHPTGAYTITGDITSDKDGDVDDLDDWFAVPLMAGETIIMGGTVSYGLAAEFYDPMFGYVDSYGFETIEDNGLGSAGMTLEPMRFTAKMAGVYYIHVFDYLATVLDYLPYGVYSLSVSGVSGTVLGGVNIVGDHVGYHDGWEYTGNGDAAGYNIATEVGGTLGAVRISGNAYYTSAYAMDGGDLIAFEAGQIGTEIDDVYTTGYIGSDGNIGRVAATVGYMAADIVAGGHGVSPNAYIQNIYAATSLDYVCDIDATGSIGVIEVGGMLGGATITVNEDLVGPGGFIGLIDVGGDWGGSGARQGVPSITHGIGGDVGYVHVAGDIYQITGVWLTLLDPVFVTDGTTRTLIDDGGGEVRITPEVDAVTGVPTTYSYMHIPLRTDVGGIIANITADGPLTLSATGLVQIGELNVTGVLGANSGITMSGTGKLDVYYLNTDDAASITNNTEGQLVSGSVGSVDSMKWDGSIGMAYHEPTMTWAHGFDVAAGDPLYGWYNGRVNGLTVNGDIGNLLVGGALGDLRVFGEIGDVRVNSGGYTPGGEWHGVNGVVWAQTRIGKIDVGDGLADDGGAYLPRAGIFSSGSIGKVSIKGPYQKSNNQVFGLLNGTIIGTFDELIVIGTDRFGISITKEIQAVDKVTATDGAVITALIVGGGFDSFQAMKIGSYVISGSVGTVSASGRHAAIDGAGIFGTAVEKVTSVSGTLGVLNSTISGTFPNVAKYAVGEVSGGGAGVINTLIDAQGVIGAIKGLDSESDIIDCIIYSSGNTRNISARDIKRNDMQIVGTLEKLSADRDLWGDENWNDAWNPTGSFGGLGQVTVGRDFAWNIFNVAGLVGGINVGGHFYSSVLTMVGPSMSFLKSLTVEGDISGEIVCGGSIGEIISRSGAIYADITANYMDWGGDVGLIETLRGYYGELEIAGSLGEFISHAALGVNPLDAADGKTQTISIGGNLGSLKVGSKKTTADFYANVNVGGDIGKVDISGDYYGSIQTNGNLESLSVGGKFGDAVNDLGEVIVLGELESLKFSDEGDIAVDMTVGGSLGKIALKGGSILGNLTSRSGVIEGIKLADGSIEGNITANSIGAVSVKDGSITGNLTADNGTIESITVKNGSIDGDITINGGALEKLSISNGNLSGNVNVSGGIGKLSISKGDLLSDEIVSGRGITSLAVKGGKTGGGMINGTTISAQTGISKISAQAGIINATIRSATKIDSATAGWMDNTYISAGWHVGSVKVSGNVANSHILAGYDVGADGVLGTADDKAPRSGDIKSIKVGGNLTNTMVAAGINPVDGDFWNGTIDDLDGVSRIVKMSVKGSATGSMIMADTSIDPKAPAGAVQAVQNGLVLNPVGTAFGSDVGVKQLIVGGLTLSLSGAGTGTYNDATKTLVLNGTTSKTSLTIVNEGGHVDLNITGSEDSELSKLQIKGDVSLDRVEIHGMVKKLAAASGTLGADWEIFGGVGSATVGDLSGVTVKVGEVGSWKMESMNAGSLWADSIKSFSSRNAVTGMMTVSMGDVGKIDVREGDLEGGVEVLAGSVKSISVKSGSITGDVLLQAGELGSVKVGGDITKRLEVWGGAVKGIAAKGEFSGSFRNDMGVGSFSVGGFSGLLSIDGDLKTLKIADAMTGLLRTSGSLKSASVGSMVQATMFVSGSLGSLKMSGDMIESWIAAGLDPGDAGFTIADGETGNLMIDADSDPLRAGQQDISMGGNIGKVTIGGEMLNSSISAGVNPGLDGFLGTLDDTVGGVGYIGSVKVTYAIHGTVRSCGVFAASAMPEKVLHWKSKPFELSGSATVESMSGPAGDLQVTGMLLGPDFLQIYFSNPINMSTISTIWTNNDIGATNTIEVLVSSDIGFAPGSTTNVSSDVAHTITYNPDDFSVTMKLNQHTWDSIGTYPFMQVTLDGSPGVGGMDDYGFLLPGNVAITDTRGSVLDGEANAAMPSGDDKPGGDFVYVSMVGDMPDNFVDAHSMLPLPLAPGGTLTISSAFETMGDIDIYRVDATSYEYLAVAFSGLRFVDVGVFVRDEMGGSLTGPSYELIAKWDSSDFNGDDFQAFELPQSNYAAAPSAEEYYIALSPNFYIGEYQLELTLAATDADLIAALGGGLPAGGEIAYVSNAIGDQNNLLGSNDPRQLVFLDFDGGTGTKGWVAGIDVGAFDLADIDPTIDGFEDEIINGSVAMGITGIVDNVVSIFANNPLDVTVELITTQAQWDAVVADPNGEGIYFTTTDPLTWALDPETDYTTIFIGNADDSVFGMSLLGVASGIDVANQSKADNGVVFAQNFGMYWSAISFDPDAGVMLNQLSRAYANTTAHELGHTLGLNHQPKTWQSEMLWPDDPNNDGDSSDSNTGLALMAYNDTMSELRELTGLGTAWLDTGEFSGGGDIDTATMMFWWLS